MYQCQNCGGTLKFDIASQQVICQYCHTSFRPYEIREQKDAEETNYFDTVIFTCKQCGGEIYTIDEEAASFCSYCGMPAVMQSRISRELRPDYIIPFQKTKEDCKKAYAKRMKYAFFVPDEFRKEKNLDEFRGIYMPYWNYRLIQRGNYQLEGIKTRNCVDRYEVDHYLCEVELSNYFTGLYYDAASEYYDNVSELVAPYDLTKIVDFSPSYFLGFYADTADVPENVYEEEVINLAIDNTYQEIEECLKENDLEVADSVEVKRVLKGSTQRQKADRTMFPVWFLTYHKKDRVAYAVVNGQTGKVVSDMPVDVRKYYLYTVLLSIPLFLALNLFHLVDISLHSSMVAAVMVITMVLYYREVIWVRSRNANHGDMGLISRGQNGWREELHKHKDNKLIGLTLFEGLLIGYLLWIRITNPVLDAYYQCGEWFCYIIMMIAINDMINRYNLLASRKLPQYQKKGGNHRG